MDIRFDRIEQAQQQMRANGMAGIMVMNHDDFTYFLGRDWSQPRAVIPFEGPPVLIAFAGEEPTLREIYKGAEFRFYTHVGEMIKAVTSTFSEIVKRAEQALTYQDKLKVGMQLWFDTPAFLVDMFRQVNPRLELVSSDSIMDSLRMIKEPEEVKALTNAQRIAALGMERARQALRPGVSAREVAAEALYVMMKEGSDGSSTPPYVNFGAETCMIHGGLSPKPLEKGDLIIIDLTPQYEGYCANLARTFVLGEPDDLPRKLHDCYLEMVAATRKMLKPGLTEKELDVRGKEICTAHGFGDYHIEGISHGIGLRFEEIPASTIIRQHRNVPFEEGMTITIGHTVLAVPGMGGFRHEDVYYLAKDGVEILSDYQCDFVV